jgi:hypothetical protein
MASLGSQGRPRAMFRPLLPLLLLAACARPHAAPRQSTREVVAAGETYLAISSSPLGRYGLTDQATLDALGSGPTSWPGWAGPFSDLLAAAPEQGRIYGLQQHTLVAWDIADGGVKRQVNTLLTNDLAWTGSRLLTLDCEHLYQDDLDGGRTSLVNATSCNSSYAFGTRWPWFAHESNSFLTLDNLETGQRLVSTLDLCADFAITRTHVWVLRLGRGDGGMQVELWRALLPQGPDDAIGTPEFRFADPMMAELKANDSQVACTFGERGVLFDDGEGPFPVTEEGGTTGLAFEGEDGGLLYSVAGVGVVRRRW